MLDTYKKTVKDPALMAANIRDFYYTHCKPGDLRDGGNWYLSAHEIAQSFADRFGSTVVQVSAVISALSPACNWETNVADTVTVLKGFNAGIPSDRLTVSTYGQNKDKAYAILESDGSFETVLTFFRADTKTRSFFINIVKPGRSAFVTVDRHAIGVALQSTDTSHQALSITQCRYRSIQQAYQLAATLCGFNCPATLQAVTWIAYRREIAQYDAKKLQELAPF